MGFLSYQVSSGRDTNQADRFVERIRIPQMLIVSSNRVLLFAAPRHAPIRPARPNRRSNGRAGSRYDTRYLRSNNLPSLACDVAHGVACIDDKRSIMYDSFVIE